MNKNNYNKKTPWVTIVIVTVAVIGLGYLIINSSPENSKSASGDAMHGSPGAPNTKELNALVGQPLPSIQLVGANGKSYSANDFKGKYTVLFFNEGLMCYPACWSQMASFGSDERFNSKEIQVFSIVADSARDWQTAIAKMPELAKATTLFDSGAVVSKNLGMAYANSSMHRGTLPGHTYVLIDKDGIVRYVFDDPNMAINNDAIFNKIQELNK